MTIHKYILDANGEPIRETDLLKWASWFETNIARNLCVVKREQVGDAEISTVFIAMPPVISLMQPDKDPLLWETMIFGGDHDLYQERCGGSREQAEAMHERVKAWLITQQELKDKPKRHFNL